MQENFQRYIYEGPVMLFGTCVANCWRGETVAPTKQKARSNLIYQFKKQSNLVASSKITLAGEIKIG